MSRQPIAFISYAHKDRDQVYPIASYIERLGVRTWFDKKDLVAGDFLVACISDAVSKSDLYVVALSPDAVSSKWVNRELDLALTLEVDQRHPKILPVIVKEVVVPAKLKGRVYTDLSLSWDMSSLKAAIHKHFPHLSSRKSKSEDDQAERSLTSVTLRFRAETNKSYGNSCSDENARNNVESETVSLLKRLREEAHGFLMNFVRPAEMDFKSPTPRFSNGEVTEYSEDVADDLCGTIRKRAIIDVEVLNPDEHKLATVVSELEALGVSRIVYSFLVLPPIDDLPRITLQKLQDGYVIRRSGGENGVDVKLPNGVILSVAATSNRIRLGLETSREGHSKNAWREFSIREFVDSLLHVE